MPRNVIELTLPSELGYEKVAIASAASVAKKMGFSGERTEDVKTAVAEACTNAIEHGNKGKKDAKVVILFTEGPERLEISVKDQGPGVDLRTFRNPSIEDKVKSPHHTRGWGVYLIQSLIDKVEFHSGTNGGEVKMIINLKRNGE